MEPRHRTAAILCKPGPRWSVGGLFLDALGHRDFDAMAECLDPDVTFRALVPPGPFQVAGSEHVIARFRRWFGGPDELEIIDATVGEAGPKLYLRWRVAMTPSSPSEHTRVVEQHVFATIADRIVGLDLLCSGFTPTRPTAHTDPSPLTPPRRRDHHAQVRDRTDSARRG